MQKYKKNPVTATTVAGFLLIIIILFLLGFTEYLTWFHRIKAALLFLAPYLASPSKGGGSAKLKQAWLCSCLAPYLTSSNLNYSVYQILMNTRKR
jgi:Ni,Fe-hydrogenase I cytochrome b subunit